MLRPQPLHIRGTDIDDEVLSLARYHARQAGVEGHIHWQRQPVSELRARQPYGCIVCNPPYGQRLEDVPTVQHLYREMGQVFRQLDTWSFFVLTAFSGFEKCLGRKSDRNRKLYNGRIQCYYYQYLGPRPPRRDRPQKG